MSAYTKFPYETRLNVLHGPLEVVDEKAIADACEFDWAAQNCKNFFNLFKCLTAQPLSSAPVLASVIINFS